MLIYDGTNDYFKNGLRELAEGISSGTITVALGDTIKVHQTYGVMVTFEAVEVSDDYTRVLWERTAENRSPWVEDNLPLILEDILDGWTVPHCSLRYMKSLSESAGSWSWINSPIPPLETVMYPYMFPRVPVSWSPWGAPIWASDLRGRLSDPHFRIL